MESQALGDSFRSSVVTMQWSVGPHLGARRKYRPMIGALFEAWTKVQPYTNWCQYVHL